MGRSEYDPGVRGARAWNAGKLVGAKKALKPQQVWAIRFMLDHEQRVRDRALFDLARTPSDRRASAKRGACAVFFHSMRRT